jgi:hypothetical protein
MSVLEDFQEFELFAAEVKRSVRTVERWTEEPDGLPFTKAGNLRLIHIPTAKQWLLDRMQRRNPRLAGQNEPSAPIVRSKPGLSHF